jgi:hypothetical protein
MSTKETVVSTVVSKDDPVEATPFTSYTDSAQADMLDLRQKRRSIPHMVAAASVKDRIRLNAAASVPPEFVELTTVAVANETSLVRGDGATPDEIRDLTAFADAYGPYADELEALALFVRHSVNAARHRVGTEALTTYSLAQRLSKQPAYAHLVPYVADMRRALGRFRKVTAQQSKAAKAAKAS